MAKIEIVVTEFGNDYRKGILSFNDRVILNTLEPADANLFATDNLDTILKAKAKSKCAIPYGAYEVVQLYSPKFKRVVPVLKNVIGFEGIEIHEGNTSADTLGCILVGCNSLPGKDFIGYSKTAVRILNDYLSACSNEMILLTIKKK